MPTCDEEGPRNVVPMRSDLFAVTAVDVLKTCAIDAYDDWQAALAVSVEAARATRAAIGTPREAFALDRACARHEAAKRAELTYSRARERWFKAQPEKAAIYRRRYNLRDCL